MTARCNQSRRPAAAGARRAPVGAGAPLSPYPRLAAWLAGRRAVEATRGEVLFADGEPYGGALFLTHGVVTLCKTLARGRAVIVAIETAGSLLGETPHLTGEPTYTATARVAEPARVIRLGPQALEECLREPAVSREMLENLARKLQGVQRTIVELTLTDAQRRLERFLHSLERAGRRGEGEVLPVTVVLPFRKRELADLIGVTPETLSRVLQALEAAGAVQRLPGRRLRLLRPLGPHSG